MIEDVEVLLMMKLDVIEKWLVGWWLKDVFFKDVGGLVFSFVIFFC